MLTATDEEMWQIAQPLEYFIARTKHKCQRCTRFFANEAALKEYQCQLQIKKEKCPHCSKTINCTNNLEKHLRSCEKAPTYPSKQQLRQTTLDGPIALEKGPSKPKKFMVEKVQVSGAPAEHAECWKVLSLFFTFFHQSATFFHQFVTFLHIFKLFFHKFVTFCYFFSLVCYFFSLFFHQFVTFVSLVCDVFSLFVTFVSLVCDFFFRSLSLFDIFFYFFVTFLHQFVTFFSLFITSLLLYFPNLLHFYHFLLLFFNFLPFFVTFFTLFVTCFTSCSFFSTFCHICYFFLHFSLFFSTFCHFFFASL